MRKLEICKSCSKFKSVTFPIIEDTVFKGETRCLCELKTNEWVVEEMYDRGDKPENCIMKMEYMVLEQ